MTRTATTATQLADRLRDVQVTARGELEVSRHIFRGEPSYVIHDPMTFRAHRFSAQDYQIYVALGGSRPLGRVFDDLVERGILDRSREERFYSFVVQLHQLGLLNLPLSDGQSLYERFARKKSARLRSRITGCLFLQVPLFQPDALLSRTHRLVAPLFSRTALLLWIVALATSLYVISARWHDFRSPLATMLTLQNLPLLWTLLVVMKLWHELGHAYACKHFGGQVPEMGAYFIVLTPCAYVDTTAAWSFTSRWHRLVVSLAGMYFESILAMIALAVWCLTAPSTIHSAAHYAVILATIVTIGFNINPLMRYDGYYILSDLLNIPNLRQIAAAQLLATSKRILFGIHTPGPGRSPAGRFGLCLFGAASGAYRLLLIVGICGMLALRIPAVGLAVGLAFLTGSCWSLGSRLARYLCWSNEVLPVRRRAIAVSVLGLALVVSTALLLPAPGATQVLGTVERLDDQKVRASSTGFLERPATSVGHSLAAGQPVCRLDNIEMTAAVLRKSAEIEQLRVELYRLAEAEPHGAAQAAAQLHRAERELRELQQIADSLIVRSPIDGRVIEATGLETVGRLVRKGEPLATVSAGPWVIRAVATQETVARSKPTRGDRVDIRLTGHSGPLLQGRVIQIARAGSHQVHAQSLTHLAGGSIAVTADNMQAEEPYFEMKIAIENASDDLLRHGMTALAVFSRGRVPLGLHLYRRTLQFFNQLRMA